MELAFSENTLGEWMPFKDQAFKALQLEWYERLKNSGFRDIESRSGNLRPAIDQRTLNRAMLDRDQRISYFERAITYLSEVEVNSRDFNIWTLHCEGFSVRAIERELGIDHATVQFRIKKMRMRANLD